MGCHHGGTSIGKLTNPGRRLGGHRREAAIAWTTTRLDGVRIDRARQRVSLPGSALPLIRNLLIFSAKYGLAVAVAIAPASRASLAFWDVAVSGASAGYFLSWLARFVSAYRRTTDQISISVNS
jgi:hypothetical protein